MSQTESLLAWLPELGSPEELRKVEPFPTAREANAHVHLPPNFSAFSSLEQAVSLAAEQGVAVLGISNYYDYSIYARFQREARGRGIFPLFGTEIIVLEREMADQGVLTNDPKNPGKIYICGKAITRFMELSPEAKRILGTIIGNDRARMAEMVRRIVAHLAENGLPIRLTDGDIVGSIVAEYSVPPETVTLQERHVARALQQEIFKQVAPARRREALSRAFGAEPAGNLEDPVKVQDEIRTHLMKIGRPGYVDETFVALAESVRLILALGGVPCYPTLADGTSPITDFESDPERLASWIQGRGMFAAEFIPIRNKLEVLTHFAKAMRRCGLVLTAGTEHNTLDLIQVPPFCKDQPLSRELKDIFWEGACVMAAHQYLTAQGLCGYVDNQGRLNPAYATQEERIADLRRIGEGVIRRAT